MYAFNDNNNSTDHHSNFIINIIENISLFCFDINDSLNTENIKNTWKLNIYNYENSNNIDLTENGKVLRKESIK